MKHELTGPVLCRAADYVLLGVENVYQQDCVRSFSVDIMHAHNALEYISRSVCTQHNMNLIICI